MIAHSFDEAFSQVQGLVNDFRDNEAHFLSTKYSEPRVREDFINKFWMALGWDVTHSEQKNPYEQEVTVEKNVSVEGRGKRADYAFTVAPNFRDVRFFVEAKKPNRNIDNADDYFQTVRYGWSARTSVAVLTDFEQFRVLDCRYEPDIDSVLSYGALEKFHYSDYADAEKFRRIYHLFSRADVAGGSLERYAEGLPKPGARGQRALFVTGRFKSVDESFLEKLDEYRARLAQTFKSNNPQLESPELTEITQRTLDRLVFIRFLEDKLIETSELVQKIVDSPRPWREFVATSRKLNATYNGIIFKEHDLLDGADFKVDESVFVDICASLSYARSPYNFNYIPIHILGSIYERFLGKTIVVKGAEASVQDKPEVRKAGGVYYTPEYIVRYIVENTVGQLIKEKTPEEISSMRFADISCGSGSFLIGVYDLLLRYHRTYYNASKKRKAEGRRAGGVELPDGSLQLSLKQKRDILTDNIYGVDIDAQAVEVAQLSLYLKLLEDETTASARLYQIELGDKLLPSLSKNIISGNSLINWDIIVSDEMQRKLNPMSFEDAFTKIMKGGGFDAIVGNPPYIRIQTMQEIAPEAVDYYKKGYAAANKGNYDIYVVFVERALQLLNEHGRLGYILPHKFFNAQYGTPLRSLIAKGKHLSHIVHFGDKQVFAGATTYTCLLFLNKASTNQFLFSKVEDLSSWQTANNAKEGNINTTQVTANEWNFAVGEGALLFEKLSRVSIKLGDVADIFVGLQTSADDVFIMDYIAESEQTIQLHSKALNAEWKFEKTLLFPLISGTDVNRYADLPERQYIIFPYKIEEDTVELINFNMISKRYPKTAAYLLQNRKRLEEREKGRMKGPQWYGYIYLKNMRRQSIEKLCVPRLVEELYAAYDAVGNHFLDNVDVGGIVWKLNSTGHSLKYLLGLLNSKLLRWYFPFVSAPFRGGWLSANKQFLSQLPIHTINLSTDKAKHDKVVQLVEQMLDAKKQLAEATTDRDKNLYERKCANLDRQIDELVYELYGLTKEEIELVEASCGLSNKL